MHAAPVPYLPRERDAHDLTLAAKPDGTLDLETAGLEPSLPFVPKGAVDAKNQFVLAFDYFCPEGIPDLSVAYGEPWSDERTARGLALPKAEVFQPFRVNLNRVSGGKFGGDGGVGLRLGFGGRANVRIQLRHVRVEVPDEDDLKDPAQLRAERESRLAHDRAVSDYLAAHFLFDEAHARLCKGQIQFYATRTGDQTDKSGQLFLAQFPIWARPWLMMLSNPPGADETGLHIEQPVESVLTDDGRHGVEAWIPRETGGHDRLTSRWAVVEKVGDGYQLRSPAVYLDDQSIPAKFASEPITVTTKKGMGGVNGHIDELVELGVGSVTVNLTPTQFFRLEPGSGRIPFVYQGHTYYFQEDGAEGVGKYDEILKQCADHNIKAALIVLIQKDGPEGVGQLLSHPDVSKSGTYPMPNMTTEAATDAYGAILAFLGQRWGDRHGEHGYAPYWILHNEVDYGWTWTNMGEAPIGVYMDTYVRSMRLCSLLARQFCPDARVFISLTHSWDVPPDPKMRTYPPKKMLEMLAAFSKREGDFDWGVAYHPYPQSLFEAASWNDKNAAFSYNTRFITPKNIEVLDAFMHEPFMLYRGAKLRPVILSEQGFHTRDYGEKQQHLQAAAFVYMFDKIRPLESIEGFQNHRWIDAAGEGGLMLGIRTLPDEQHPRGEKKLAWSIYQAIDTPDEAAKTQFAKGIICVPDLSDVPYKGQIEGATVNKKSE